MQVKAATDFGSNYAPRRAADTPSTATTPEASNATSGAADARGGLYGLRTREFAGLLNMARPMNAALGEVLIAPQMALSLQSERSKGDTYTDVTNQQREYAATDSSLASRAREMVQLLGDGESISLADAIKALGGENPGKSTNSERMIAQYFDRLDADASGTLTQTELLDLIDYHHRHQNDRGGPLLPATWI